MKLISLVLFLIFFSVTAFAQESIRPDGQGGWTVEDTGGCGALSGFAKGACIAEREQTQRQQLQQQQLLQQQQIENQRLQNELLRRKLDQEQTGAQSRQEAPQVDFSKSPIFQNWQTANPWFGSDRAKTEYALLYAEQLRKDQPNLSGRPFLDAVTARVMDVFGARK